MNTTGRLYWNYFLALERDLETLSRYIEFHPRNYQVFSIELAHLVFAAASEVDVIAKSVCSLLEPSISWKKIKNYKIKDYQRAIETRIPDLISMQVFVPRYDLDFVPWSGWTQDVSPAWWTSYNRVEHQRDRSFEEASLENVLNALGALLMMIYQYHKLLVTSAGGSRLRPQDVTREMQPDSTLIRLPENYYYMTVITGPP